MSDVDVRELAREKLPQGDFPASMRSDFRVHIAPKVMQGIESHAKADNSVEICGVLVGSWGQDEDGPFADVSDYIRCDNAASKFAEVTFTHESWSQINGEMDTKYADKRIVGWYHSHPDFGIFLSDRDCFIQQHFFSGPGQIAYVIDPVRDLEGIFAWRKGKPTPLEHFWVGDDIRLSQPAENAPRHEGKAAELSRKAAAADGAGVPYAGERAPAPLSLWILTGLSVFLLGYLYSGMLNRVQEQRMMDGLIARFFNYKVLGTKLETELDMVRTQIASVSAEIEKSPKPGDELSKDQVATALKQRQLIADNLKVAEVAVAIIKDRYTLSADEQAAIKRRFDEEQAILKAAAQAPPATPDKSKGSGAKSGSSTSPSSSTPSTTGGTAPATSAPAASTPVMGPLPEGAASPPTPSTGAPANGAAPEAAGSSPPTTKTP